MGKRREAPVSRAAGLLASPGVGLSAAIVAVNPMTPAARPVSEDS
jgi:hypothetical protein